MEMIEAKVGDYTESVSDKLRGMAISKTKALKIESGDAQSVRSLISRLHQQDKKVKYITTKSDTGILVWRVK